MIRTIFGIVVRLVGLLSLCGALAYGAARWMWRDVGAEAESAPGNALTLIYVAIALSIIAERATRSANLPEWRARRILLWLLGSFLATAATGTALGLLTEFDPALFITALHFACGATAAVLIYTAVRTSAPAS